MYQPTQDTPIDDSGRLLLASIATVIRPSPASYPTTWCVDRDILRHGERRTDSKRIASPPRFRSTDSCCHGLQRAVPTTASPTQQLSPAGQAPSRHGRKNPIRYQAVYELPAAGIKQDFRYTLTLVPEVHDLHGNTMTAAVVAHFVGRAPDPSRPDDSPPLTPTPAIGAPPGEIALGKPLVLTGSGTAGNYVKVLWDGIDVFPRGVLVDASGQWRMDLPAPPVGVTTFEAAEFDYRGNTSRLSEPVSTRVALPKSPDGVLVLTAGAGREPAFQGTWRFNSEPGQAIYFKTTSGRGLEQPARASLEVDGEQVSFDFGEGLAGPFSTSELGDVRLTISPSDMVEQATITAVANGQEFHSQTVSMAPPFIGVTQPRHLIDDESTTMLATVRGISYDAAGNQVAVPLTDHRIRINFQPLVAADFPFLRIAVDPPGGGGSPPNDPDSPPPASYRATPCGKSFGPPPPSTPPPTPPPAGPADTTSNKIGIAFAVLPMPGAPSGPNPQFNVAVTDLSVALGDGSHPTFVTETKSTRVRPTKKPLQPTDTPIGDNTVAVSEPTNNPSVGTTRVHKKTDTPPPTPDPVEPEEKPEPKDQVPCSDPVILHSGEYQLRATDLLVESRGFDWEFTRTYKSRIGYNGPLGHNWTFAQNTYVEPDTGNPTILRWHTGYGKSLPYLRTAANEYRSPNGHFDRLTVSPATGIITIRQRTGRRLHFHSLSTGSLAGKVDRIVDRNGNSTRFFYDPATGLLAKVRDTLSREYSFHWINGRLASVTDFSGRQVRFGYDMWGNLVEVTSPIVFGTSTANDFPDGRITRYTYSQGFPDARLNHNLLTITAPEQSANNGDPWLVNCYGTDPNSYAYDKVIRQDVGGRTAAGVMAGGTFIYSYETVNPDEHALNLPKSITVVTDRMGNVNELQFNANGNAVREVIHTNRNVRPSGTGLAEDPDSFVTTHVYDADGNRLVTVWPEGNVTERFFGNEDIDRDGILDPGRDTNQDGDFHDPEDLLPEDRNGNGVLDLSPRFAQGNLLEIRFVPDANRGGGNPIVEKYSYEPVFNRLRSLVDPRAFDVDFTPQNGGPVTPARYTTLNFFDYQEGDATQVLPKLAKELGVPNAEMAAMLQRAGVDLALGDINGDANTDQVSGNIVRRSFPSVHLLPEQSYLVAATGGSVQSVDHLFAQDRFGQPVYHIDPELNRAEFLYHPEGDPDGDGQDLNPLTVANSGEPFDADTGGYLAVATQDTSSDPVRDSGTDPAPAKLKTKYGYDHVGNVIEVTDARGIVHTYEFNALNEVIRNTVAADASTNLNPTEPGNLLSFGYERELHYNANGKLVMVRDENTGAMDGGAGRSNSNPFWATRYVYDILDHVVTKIREVQPIADDRVMTQSSPGVVATRYRYSANENLIDLTLPESNRRTWLYDERQLRFSETRGTDTADAGRSFAHYDRNADLVVRTDAEDNGVADPEYGADPIIIDRDGFGRISQVRDSEQNRRTVQYEPTSQIVRDVWFAPIADGGRRLSEKEYLFDELGRTFRVDYKIFSAPGGSAGNSIPTVASPSNDVEAVYWYEFDKNSRLVRSVQPDGADLLISHDGANRRIRMQSAPVGVSSNAARNTIEWRHDGNSNITRVTTAERSTDPSRPTETFITDYVHDALNRCSRVTNNLGLTSRAAHDSRGNVIAYSGPKGPDMNDPLGIFPRPSVAGTSASINAHGNVTRYYYDGLSRPTAREILLQPTGDGDGTLDGGQAIPTNLASDKTIRAENGWDGNSRLVSEVDDNGNILTHSYDSQDRLRITQSQDGARFIAYLDADANPVRLVDRNGSMVDLSFDDIGRLTSVDVVRAHGLALSSSHVGGTTRQTFTWDGRSRLVGMTDNNDPATPQDDSICYNSYDSLDRLLEEVQISHGAAYSIVSQFARDGARTSIRYPSGRLVSTQFDALNRPILREEGQPSSAANNDIMRLSYVGGRVYERKTANDVASLIEYDGARRISKILHRRVVDGTTIAGFGYEYDRGGNRTSQRDLHDLTYGRTYKHDSADRLSEYSTGVPSTAPGGGLASVSDTVSLELDGLGSRMSRKSTADGDRHYNKTATGFQAASNNEYVSIQQENGNTDHRVHDAKGNLIDDGTLLFQYDFLNRLTAVHRKVDGAPIAHSTYDAAMRRVSRRVVAKPQSVRYVWDRWQLAEQRDGLGGLLAGYVYANYIDEVVQISGPDLQDVDNDGDRRERRNLYCHEDSTNSISAITDSNGQVVQRARYDSPFGLVSQSGHSVSTLGFHGLHLDPETGWYYNRLRQYDPKTGRFVQRDPMGTHSAMNLYDHAHGNPTRYLDPMGDWGHLVFGAVVGAVMGVMGAVSQGADLFSVESLAAGLGGAVVGVVAAASFGVGVGLTGVGKVGGYVLGAGAYGHAAALGIAVGQGRPLDAIGHMDAGILGAGGSGTPLRRPKHLKEVHSQVRQKYAIDPEVKVDANDPNYRAKFFRGGGYCPPGWHVDHYPARSVARQTGQRCNLQASPAEENLGWSPWDKHHATKARRVRQHDGDPTAIGEVNEAMHSEEAPRRQTMDSRTQRLHARSRQYGSQGYSGEPPKPRGWRRDDTFSTWSARQQNRSSQR